MSEIKLKLGKTTSTIPMIMVDFIEHMETHFEIVLKPEYHSGQRFLFRDSMCIQFCMGKDSSKSYLRIG